MKISRGLVVTAGLAAIVASIAFKGHSAPMVDLSRHEMRLDSNGCLDGARETQRSTSVPWLHEIRSSPCKERRPQLLTSVYPEQKGTS